MRARVWAAIVVSSLGWGTAGIATRAAFREGLQPYTIIGMRALIAAGAVFAYRLAKRRPLPGRALWALGAVLGTTNITVPYILFTLAVQHASAGFVGLLIAGIPLATAAWAHFLLPDEPLHRGKALGLILAMAGVAALTLSGDSGIGDAGSPGLAIGLTLAGVAVAAFGGVHARRHAPDHHVLDLAGPQFAIGAVVLLVAMTAIEGFPSGVSGAGWGLVAYMALAGTFMPFLLFFWMLQRVSATKAALPGYLVPMVALAGGALLLDERVTIAIGVGAMLILAGVVLTERAAGRPIGGPAPEIGDLPEALR